MKCNKKVYKVSLITIICNLFLAILKMIAGIVSNSGAMISDAIHTISDIGTTIIAFVGVIFANKSEDDEHRYGHERLECIASLLLAMILFITGLELGFNGLKLLVNGNYDKVPGLFALIAAFISIIVKELMFQYTIRVAIDVKSDALKADAWHHRSDSLSSIGALLGIVLSMLGFTFFDSIASVAISILVCKVAIDIFLEATNKLVDKSCDDEKIEKIKNVVFSVKGVKGIDDIKTRMFGNKIYVDIEIALDGDKTLRQTHRIAERVHDEVEKEFYDIKHIMVHVNPFERRKKR